MLEEENKKKFLLISFVFILLSILLGSAIYYIKKERYRGVIYSCRG